MAMAVLRVPVRLEEFGLSRRQPKQQQQVDELEYDGVAVVMEKEDHEEEAAAAEEEDGPLQADVWKAIQAKKTAAEPLLPPYVHPLVRRSSSSMSQRSLNTCTERLGSETGSDDFSDFLESLDLDLSSEAEKQLGEKEEEEVESDADGYTDQETEAPPPPALREVNYHRSNGKRLRERCFPPPLPSISSRHTPCLHVRPRRCDGRLVLNAVHAPCLNYLQAQREDGRLLLSFIGAASDAAKTNTEQTQLEESEAVDEPEEEEEEEDEEEVEVFDRGTVVEFKVSQQQSGSGKVLRSSIVINKFVGGGKCEAEKDTGQMQSNVAESPHTSTPRRAPAPTSATAAAAVVVTSTLSSTGDGRDQMPEDNKLLFTSKKRDREEMLRSMRRCSSELRMPLFIWDPCCIATS
ncbi:protein FAF-like, chloroplastic [Zingiber officinale]|uniref:FAF domain-containing protein n=1 Tax=Zingiber officinale TaxID=94328 RepID=A0A8J5KWD5_ZINOF|nr:protein FAF-like, chloroplastic [Zingiber officinale]KAG6498714.1 hypothetical protein ZIOFF_038436 [Zingiber officinale]